MTSEKSDSRSEIPRRKLIEQGSEYLTGDPEVAFDEIRLMVLHVHSTLPWSVTLSNENLMDTIKYLADNGELSADQMDEVILEAVTPFSPFDRKRIPKSGRGRKPFELPKGKGQIQRADLSRDAAAESLQEVLDKHREGRGDQKSYPSAQDALDIVEKNLGNKTYTNRMILRAARRLHRRNILITPMGLANEVIEAFKGRANRRIIFISTPT